MATLAVLDGHSLAYRAFYALPMGMATKSGELINATFGFTNMLLDVLNRIQPEYVAIAFDVGETWRHERYEPYKGHRGKAPNELEAQVERIKEVVQAFNIPIFTAQGWEADDVLATLARQAAEQGTNVVIVTGDTDAHQLVTERIQVEQSQGGGSGRSKGSKLYDVAAVEARYGLRVDQLIDYKAMLGDSSDNIPGVKGVGKKTAAKLLVEYDTLDNIYDNLPKLKKGVRNRLIAGRENAFLSRELVTIEKAVPGIELDLDACLVGDFDKQTVLNLFGTLQFTTLVKRLPKTTRKKSSSRPVPGQIEIDYRVVQDEASVEALVEVLKQAESVTLDVETNSVNTMTAKLVGLAIGVGNGKAYYLPFAHRGGLPSGQLSFDMMESSDPRNLPLEKTAQRLNPLFRREGLKIYAHNAKFDVKVLLRHGFEVPTVTHDTMIGAWIISPDSPIGLKSLALTELGENMTEISELIGSGRKQITMDYVDIEKVVPYACADVDMTSRLVPLQTKQLKERGLYRLFHEIEMPLIRVLVDIEMRGIGFDAKALIDVRQHITNRLAMLEAQVYEVAGYEFNIQSTQQLSDLLFNQLGLDKRKSRRTKSGYYSTAVQVLEALKEDHFIAEFILEQRSLQKLLSTYVDQLPAMVNPTTKRIHSDFSQTSAGTGRLSSSNPNLQNIPTRTELGQQIRRAFVTPANHFLLAVDYSQVELRVLAHLSGDEAMIAAFQRGEDIHAATATRIFKVQLEQVTREQRRIAKAVNFGLLFGMSAFRLSRETGLEYKEAEKVFEAYFENYPGIKRYLEGIVEGVQKQGYAETIMGRRRYYPILQRDPLSNQGRAAERAAKNHPIQGSAAEIIKIAMINLHEQLREKGLRTRMVLQVHDELLFDIPEEELEVVTPFIIDMMVNAMELSVPVKVDAKVGQNWAEMVDLDEFME